MAPTYLRPSAHLAAVLPMHAVAALLNVETRAFAKRVRSGAVAGAHQSFESIGYVFGWRSVERLLAEAYTGDRLEEARRQLLALRAGRLRAVEGALVEVPQAPMAPTDQHTDEELLDVVRACAQPDQSLTPASFDQRAASRGYHHRDVMVRLSASDWNSVCRRAGLAVNEEHAAQLDLSDPHIALGEAAGEQTGRHLTPKRFDAWADTAGSPLRAAQLRRLYGGWNQAKLAAGLEVNDHNRHGDG